MKIVVTGGHISPALAVLEELPKDAEVLFIGRHYPLEGDDAISLEKRTIDGLGIPFESITTGRIQRKFTKFTLFSLAKIPVGLVQSYQILKKFQPDVVLTFGGYVALPVALASRMLGIPVVIHEQTLEAGFANKIIEKFAKKICTSWESSHRFFSEKKIVLTGNPLRKEFFQNKKEELDFIPSEFTHEKLPCIYITGGSLGSHAINILIAQGLQALLHNYTIIHQTGDARTYKDYENLTALRLKLPKALQNRYVLTRFVPPRCVNAVMQKADLVIARSGINTITELIYLNKMSLLIPLPHSQHDEQRKNALYLKNVGLGEILDQDTTSVAHLLSVVEGMMKQKSKYSLSDPDISVKKGEVAAGKIVEVLLSVV